MLLPVDEAGKPAMYKVGAHSIAASPTNHRQDSNVKELFDATNPKKSTLHLSKELNFNKLTTPPRDDNVKITNQSD